MSDVDQIPICMYMYVFETPARSGRGTPCHDGKAGYMN